ncbi:MAG: MaoC family dehydratase N-terminal domain-containing protein [Deltaproteobacteria bacterium]|nr:MaoC family dehydratase N-terminal domain-containing protein [Deltaproteobacteria bacterium]
MAAPKRLFLESLRIGDELPTLTKPAIDRVQIARFAGAAYDFNPMHIDETQARAGGMPSVFAHSLLPMSFMAQFLSDWLKGGRLTRLAVRFVKLVWPGDVLSCKGRVLARRRDDQGRYYVEVDLWAENQKGELVLKGHCTGQVFINAEDEQRQKRGESPLIVDVSEQTELPRNAKGKPVKPKVTPLRPPERPAAAAAPAPAPKKPAAKPAPASLPPAKPKPIAKVAGRK